MGLIENKDVRTPPKTNGGSWLAQHGSEWKDQVEKIREKFGSAIESVDFPGEGPTDVPVVMVKKTSVVALLHFLKNDLGYGFLSDLTATDEQSDPRFLVVYNLFSHAQKRRFRVKTAVSEDEEVETAIPVWPAANWYEREVFDMFGVRFAGHPDLRRILMDERWQGHPLRKDYPLRGYQIFAEPEPIRTELLK